MGASSSSSRESKRLKGKLAARVRDRPAHCCLPAQERELGALPAGFQVECRREQAQLQAFLPR